MSLFGCGISLMAWKSCETPSVTSGFVAACVKTFHMLVGTRADFRFLRKSFTTPVRVWTSHLDRFGHPLAWRNLSLRALTSDSAPGTLYSPTSLRPRASISLRQ